MIDLASDVIALADAGLHPVRLHYPIFKGDEVACSCGKGECPAGSRGKHPVAWQWGKSATRDHEVIREQFSTGPWNVGVILGPCHGIPDDQAIIDIEDDSPEGRKLADVLLADCPCPTYSSGKSLHRLFRWSDRLPQVANMTIDGLEFRFGGRSRETQSVVPPSRHNSGSYYEWLPGMSLSDLPIVELPDHVIEWILEQYMRQEESRGPGVSSSSAVSRFRSPMGKIAPGGRHHALLREANRLWRIAYNQWGINGIEEQEVIDQVWMWLAGANLLVCDPPKTEREVQVIFESSASFMKGEILRELAEAEKQQADSPEADDHAGEEADNHSFGAFLKSNGIRLRYDPTMDYTVESPERINEWTCDWQCQYVSKSDDSTILMTLRGISFEMTRAEFERADTFAYRAQVETAGSVILCKTFPFWDWKSIWNGREKKGKGITRGLKEWLITHATVSEKTGLTLADQVEEIVLAMAGSLYTLLEAMEAWKAGSERGAFHGRLKTIAGSGLSTIPAPEDPLTGWYAIDDCVELYCKLDEVNRRYRAAYGSGVPNRRISESLEELGFEKRRVGRGPMEGRWFVRPGKK